jgi:hypothetical protein
MISDVTMMRNFMRSDIWKDILSSITDELNRTIDELEKLTPGGNIDVDRFPFQVSYLQARIRTLREMADLPQALIDDEQAISSGKGARNDNDGDSD